MYKTTANAEYAYCRPNKGAQSKREQFPFGPSHDHRIICPGCFTLIPADVTREAHAHPREQPRKMHISHSVNLNRAIAGDKRHGILAARLSGLVLSGRA